MKRIAAAIVFLCYAAASHGASPETAPNPAPPVAAPASAVPASATPDMAAPSEAAPPGPPVPAAQPSRHSAPLFNLEPLEYPVSYIYFDYGIYLYGDSPGRGDTYGYRLGGGYQFNRYFALEGGASLISEAKNDAYLCGFVSCSSNSLQASSYQVAAVGFLPATYGNSSLYAKVGAAYTSLDFSYTFQPCLIGFCSPPVTGNGSASKTNMMFGLGWEEHVRPFMFRVQYENLGTTRLVTRYSDNRVQTNNVQIEVISVSLAVLF